MGTYTRMTRAWLDRRYGRTTEEGVYVAHQPVYGLGHPASELPHLPRMARTCQILRVLNRLAFRTVLDVGGAEGYLASLLRDLFGAEVLVGDLSTEAARRANGLFGLEGVAFDSARLPFRDDAFDLVVCSEVVEHVEFPVDVLLELDRVAGSALVVTTEEVTDDDARLAEHGAGRRDLPHAERNLFHFRDLELLFGAEAEYRSEFQGAAPDEPVSLEQAEAWIREATAVEAWNGADLGVVMTSLRGEGAHCEPRVPEEELLRAVLRVAHAAEPIGDLGAVAVPTAAREELRAKMVCPLCTGRLQWPEEESGTIECRNCSRTYALRGGIPALYDESAPDPSGIDLENHLLIEGLEPNAIDAIMDLRERMALPDAASQLSWEFTREEHRDAWTANEDLVAREGAAKAGSWLARGSDPWLVGPMIALPEGGAGELVIEMRIHNPDFPVDAGEGQVFWMGMGDLSFDEHRSVRFAVRNDGELHTYRVPLGEHESWPREGGLWLRLDPVNGPAEIDLHSLRLEPSAAEAARPG